MVPAASKNISFREQNLKAKIQVLEEQNENQANTLDEQQNTIIQLEAQVEQLQAEAQASGSSTREKEMEDVIEDLSREIESMGMKEADTLQEHGSHLLRAELAALEGEFNQVSSSNQELHQKLEAAESLYSKRLEAIAKLLTQEVTRKTQAEELLNQGPKNFEDIIAWLNKELDNGSRPASPKASATASPRSLSPIVSSVKEDETTFSSRFGKERQDLGPLGPTMTPPMPTLSERDRIAFTESTPDDPSWERVKNAPKKNAFGQRQQSGAFSTTGGRYESLGDLIDEGLGKGASSTSFNYNLERGSRSGSNDRSSVEPEQFSQREEAEVKLTGENFPPLSDKPTKDVAQSDAAIEEVSKPSIAASPSYSGKLQTPPVAPPKKPSFMAKFNKPNAPPAEIAINLPKPRSNAKAENVGGGEPSSKLEPEDDKSKVAPKVEGADKPVVEQAAKHETQPQTRPAPPKQAEVEVKVDPATGPSTTPQVVPKVTEATKGQSSSNAASQPVASAQQPQQQLPQRQQPQRQQWQPWQQQRQQQRQLQQQQQQQQQQQPGGTNRGNGGGQKHGKGRNRGARANDHGDSDPVGQGQNRGRGNGRDRGRGANRAP